MIGTQIVFAGPMYTEVYLGNSDEIHLRLGGPSYRAACAFLALKAPATLVATLPRYMPEGVLDKFENSEVRLFQETVSRGKDNACVFCSGEHSVSASSLGLPSRLPVDCLRNIPLRGLHVHVSIPDWELTHQAFMDIRAMHPDSSLSYHLSSEIVSSTDAASMLELAQLCSVIFMPAHIRQLVSSELLERTMEGRIVVVLEEDASAVAYVDGITYIGQTPDGPPIVSAVGLGDVFAAGFLSTLTRTRQLADAVFVGCELARASCADYGTETVLHLRHKIHATPPANFARTPNTPLASNQMPPVQYELVKEATGLFVVRDGQLLVVRKMNERAFVPDVYYVPGGKLEPGETPEQCAVRELKEETNLDARRLRPFGMTTYPNPKNPNELYRFYQYLIKDTKGLPQARDDIITWEWRPIESLRRSDVFELTWAQLALARILEQL
ncbi:MAG: NUDIX domain-containing protein [Kamptonema sp. SIO1D9]|nr:NUDIX domain-containing protein [Kamptonema sp. SIO1D9]